MACENICLDSFDSLLPSCEELKQVGGVNKRLYAVEKNLIASTTFTEDGYLSAVTLCDTGSPANKLKRFWSKKASHNATTDGAKADNGITTYNHTIVAKLYSGTPAHDESIKNLFENDETVVFVENNYGQVLVYGLDYGLTGTTLSAPSGTALTDDTGITVTIAGLQKSLPSRMKVGTSLEDVLEYLDGISEEVS